MITPREIEQGIACIKDQSSFIQRLLKETLHWDIPDHIQTFEEISYGWTAEDLRTSDLNKHLLDGTVRQIQKIIKVVIRDSHEWHEVKPMSLPGIPW